MDVVSKQIYAHAVAAFDAGRFCEAVKYFESLVESNPNEWQWRWYLCQCYHQSGNLNAAGHELTYILELCPSDLLRLKARILLKDVLHGQEQTLLPEPSIPILMSWVEHHKNESRSSS